MAFLVKGFKNLNKKVKHYFNPNENPTDFDNYAFKLLDNLNVEEFIDFFQEHNINVHVITPQGISLLTKAVEMSNKTKPGMSEQDVISQCIIAVNFLLSKGANINNQDKNGRTALLAACHWQQVLMAQLLIKHGANLDLATTQRGWITNPLIAACFKQNYELIELLIVNGANIDLAVQLNKQQNGFRMDQKQIDFIAKADNMRKILLIRKLQEKSQKIPEDRKFLSNLNLIYLSGVMEVC